MMHNYAKNIQKITDQTDKEKVVFTLEKFIWYFPLWVYSA